MAEQQYIEPKPYFVLDASQVKELQREAGDLRKEVDDPQTSWLTRTRSAERLKTVERELQASRSVQRQAEQAQQVQVQQLQRPCPGVAAREMILSDNGETYLVVGNRVKPSPPQSYMKPVAY